MEVEVVLGVVLVGLDKFVGIVDRRILAVLLVTTMTL